MIEKIIPIYFEPEQEYRWGIDGLKQWDQGQKLEISGLDISEEIVEVHFSLRENEGEAKRMLGIVENGIIYASIPAFILEGPEYTHGETYNAWAWIYLLDEESAETVRKIEFTIKTRPKPAEYVTPEELSFLEQLEALVKNKLDKSGYEPNKFLGTDKDGDVVTKDVEEFTLEVATETKLGGVKPVTKTDDMTQEVGVDKDGKLFTEQSGIDEETFLKLAIKTTTSPSPFHHITDSANMKVVDFGMEGKTEQNTVPGNQLIPPEEVRKTTYNLSAFRNNGILLEANQTYMVVLSVNADSLAFKDVTNNDNLSVAYGKNNVSYTPSEDILAFVDSYFANGVPDGVEIMLYKGSAILPIEPYTNGPSPNPDYPQEIVNAGVYNEETGRYEIGCCVGNKNFWDKEYARDVNNWFEAASITGIRFLKIPVAKGKTYRIGELPSEAEHIRLTTSTNLSGAYYGWVSNPNIGTGQQLRKFTSKEDFVYLGVSIARFEIFQEQYNNYLQIELGSTSSDYVVGQSQPFTLTSPVPLTKWDKLVKRDGVWGWSIYGKEYNFGDGDISDLSISASNYNSEMTRFTFSSAKAVKKTECFCNLFRYSSMHGTVGTCGYWFGDGMTIYISTNVLSDYGFIYDSASSNNYWNSIIAFKALLEDKGGIQIWVDMQEEQAFHPLPDEEQTVLNNLETYYDVTNVYNDQGCPMWLTYVADSKLYVDNQILAIKEAIV